MSPLLTTEQVAQILQMSPRFVRRLVKEGELYWERYRGEVISEAQLEDYINSCRADTAVYFVRMKEAGHIKIGMAKDVNARLDSLRTGNPDVLELLAFTVVVRGRQLERELHRKLAPYRLNGEWFRDGEWTQPLLALLTKGGPGVSEKKLRKALLG